jgi:hypothetical protein
MPVLITTVPYNADVLRFPDRYIVLYFFGMRNSNLQHDQLTDTPDMVNSGPAGLRLPPNAGGRRRAPLCLGPNPSCGVAE